MLKMCQVIFLISLKYSGVSKDKSYCFLDLVDTSENPEIIDMRVSGFSYKQIEKLWILNEA